MWATFAMFESADCTGAMFLQLDPGPTRASKMAFDVVGVDGHRMFNADASPTSINLGSSVESNGECIAAGGAPMGVIAAADTTEVQPPDLGAIAPPLHPTFTR